MRRALLLGLVVLASLAAAWRHAPERKDYYGMMGLDRTATEKEIKRVYKKLSRQLHPDVQKTDADREASRKKFMEVTEAYETLIDETKRKQYDDGGHTQTDGDKRNMEKNFLFSEGFDGEELREKDIMDMLDGKGTINTIVIYWSGNYPDCIDAAVPYRKLATKLRGSSVRVAALKCDDNAMACRRQNLNNLPAIVMHRAGSERTEQFHQKVELQALTAFAARYLKASSSVTRRTATAHLTDVTPNPERLLDRKRWAAQYFLETSKRSNAGEVVHEFVAFEFSNCYDCQTEVNLAVDSLLPVYPRLSVHRVDCRRPENKGFCKQRALKRENRAWTIARVTKRCWYATKRPFTFSNEVCEDLHIEEYTDKFAAPGFIEFWMKDKKSHLVKMNPKRMAKMKTADDAFAVLFADSMESLGPLAVQWELLGRSINTYQPVKSAKGFPLRAALVDCRAHAGLCVGLSHPPPFIAIYGYGTKVKQLPPQVITKLGGWQGMLADIMTEANPLHLHVLTAKTYDKKVSQSLTKGKKWFILFNAGEWCPPCNQIRPEWKKAVREVMNSPAAKKLSLGTVECDKQKKLCQELGIDNYPSMYFLAHGRPRAEFQGNRDGVALAEWAIEQIDNRVQSFHPGQLNNMIRSGETVLVSFTAGAWCPPCMQLGPVFKKVSNKFTKAPVTVVDCDKVGDFCHMFNIQGYPTIVLFKSGGQQFHYEGNKNVEQIAKWANSLV